MKRKIVWLVVSCLMVLSLVLASCAPAAPTTPTPTAPTPTAPTPTAPTPTAPTPTAPTVEKPKYGGVIVSSEPREPVVNMEHANEQRSRGPFLIQHDGLWLADWAKGPAGSGETDWGASNPIGYFQTGGIAESYEIVGDDTFIFHIRQGIHWALNPKSEASRLVGGRELTADDVVFVLKRTFNQLPEYPTPRAFALKRISPEEHPKSVTALDKWTVELKGKPGAIGQLTFFLTQMIAFYPPETIKKYGILTEWWQSVGTGPFMVTDFMSGVSTTYVRNPNYWQKDPVGPGKGQQLPYADGLKQLVITDRSTQQAALRTGKLDQVLDVSTEDTEALLKSTPYLQKARFLRSGRPMLMYRVDKPELPWYDIRVRQALQLAVDREAIKRDYYKGEAIIYSYPIPADPSWISLKLYRPFDQLPPNVQELFQYQPDKAKQLLADAGYPQGFKMEVLTEPARVDDLSLLKYYYEKVGINLDIQVRERGVLTSIAAAASHPHAIFVEASHPFYAWGAWMPGDNNISGNLSMINDPVINAEEVKYNGAFMLDDVKMARVFWDITPYALEQSWQFTFPHTYTYTVWQPWFKNYHGEVRSGIASPGKRYFAYVWIDQALKKSMGY